MLGLDTNVLVRLLVDDDKAQGAKARRLVEGAIAEGEALFLSVLVILETEWVLRSRYRFAKQEIAETFSRLLDAKELVFEDEPSLEEALYYWKDSSADFADCLIGIRNRRLGCRGTASFDAKAGKLPDYVSV